MHFLGNLIFSNDETKTYFINILETNCWHGFFIARSSVCLIEHYRILFESHSLIIYAIFLILLLRPFISYRWQLEFSQFQSLDCILWYKLNYFNQVISLVSLVQISPNWLVITLFLTLYEENVLETHSF